MVISTCMLLMRIHIWMLGGVAVENVGKGVWHRRGRGVAGEGVACIGRG